MAVKNPKEKGNREERKQAKQLSTWMFNDKDVLKRQSDSGALELIWSGDVVPLKQMPLEWKTQFPFLIEVKSGYPKDLPSFWAYNKLSKWVQKSYIESKTHNQFIVMVITQFKSRPALISMNYAIDILPYKVIFPVECEDKWLHMHVYNLKELLDIPFKTAFDFNKIIT